MREVKIPTYKPHTNHQRSSVRSHTLAPTTICDLSHSLCWSPLTDLGHISSVTYVCHPLWLVCGHRKGILTVPEYNLLVGRNFFSSHPISRLATQISRLTHPPPCPPTLITAIAPCATIFNRLLQTSLEIQKMAPTSTYKQSLRQMPSAGSFLPGLLEFGQTNGRLFPPCLPANRHSSLNSVSERPHQFNVE